jgi:hypothetical protein
LGHHTHQAGDCTAGGIAPRPLGVQLTEQQQCVDREDRKRHIAEDAVDTVHEFRSNECDMSSLGGQFASVRVGTYCRCLVAPGSSYHKTP